MKALLTGISHGPGVGMSPDSFLNAHNGPFGLCAEDTSVCTTRGWRWCGVALLWWASLGLVWAGCLPVSGNRILGSDLAAADARFAALPATLTIGFAPAPGAKRVYSGAELQRIARANGMTVADYGEICFALSMRQLTKESVGQAMRRSLPEGATLKVVETTNAAAPAGTIEFPLAGLEPPSPLTPGVQLWHGHVTYAETRQQPIWARVELSVTVTAVVAARDLAANKLIGAASLRIETRTGPLDRMKAATRIEDVAGRMPKRSLEAGSIVPLSVLAEAPTVRRGDAVEVEVQSGLARVRFEAVAENAAREGDIIELRNPANGKTFKARLEAGPRALVVIAGGPKS